MQAQIFYKDGSVITYSIVDPQMGRYFLSIPVNLYQNYLTFIKLKQEDNNRKGTGALSNDVLIRKQFLQDVMMTNELIKNLNSGLVYSRVNRLRELPVNELQSVLNPNVPFDINKYAEIVRKTDEIINDNFRLMTSPNIKKESIEQTILLVSQHEQDKEFIEWLKNNLANENNYKDINVLKTEYESSKVIFDISEYKEVVNNGKKYVIGKNSKDEMFTVELPNNYNMLQVFQMELNTINKNMLLNFDKKQVAKIVYDKLILDLKSQKMVSNFEKENKPDLGTQVLENNINQVNNGNNFLVDKENNIAINQNDNKVITTQTEGNQVITNEPEIKTNEFNNFTNAPSEAPTIVQSQGETQVQTQGKRRILVPPKGNYDGGFIKIGTIILFSLSFILTVISLVLIIAS